MLSVLMKIIKENNIHCHAMSGELSKYMKNPEKPEELITGSVLQIPGENHILYDPAASKSEKMYIIAHELGHIMFGHLRTQAAGENAEIEASIFAAVFTALNLYMEAKDQ